MTNKIKGNMGDKGEIKNKKLNTKELIKKGVPYVLIPGLILAGVLGWRGGILDKVKNYYQIKQIFPESGMVKEVEDGDTLLLENGVRVRLIGINAAGKGEKGYLEAKEQLGRLVDGKKINLEYDRYQDDKYGRILAWVWINCEDKPMFLPPDYMHLTYNSSRPGLTDNPEGCKQGKLVNEEMVKSGLAKMETYKDRGELKYEERIRLYKK